ncbi:MAG: HdeD family acid-resistance protein [Thermoguttaceae bacterium]
MNENLENAGCCERPDSALCEAKEQLMRDFKHVRGCWCCFFMLGLLLAVCGTLAIVVPFFTIASSLITVIVLGLVLMISGIVTIVSSFWIGKWSGLLLHMLVGILYLVSGFVISERPLATAVVITLFIAASFIVLGAFRIASALTLRMPQWGWVMFNGIVTLLLGVIIYRHFPNSALWVLGILIGVELLLNGWSWMMLSLAVRKIPKELPAA